ncbi:hypothetical protein CA13_21490 [Planctomycetes bacterium CA13]|uniref:Uncharacterized protein n=1 Tax=Novipirellula herctigrandis TaxID=2527986 RepID=A0A5C5Z269_9BACT|nr:hypothetical protein CA13_21490 [Planctomycetes bacterium CA13]
MGEIQRLGYTRTAKTATRQMDEVRCVSCFKMSRMKNRDPVLRIAVDELVWTRLLPSEVGECLVRIGHAVCVFAFRVSRAFLLVGG